MSQPNFMLYDENVTANTTYEVVEIHKKCISIRLYPVSGNAKIFLNDQSNEPEINLYEAMTIPIPDGRISRLIIYGATSVTVNVKQMTQISGEQVRV